MTGYMSVLFVQLVQVIINTTHLEQSCHFLEEFISNITNVPPDTVNATKLYGTSTFKVRLLFLPLSPLFSPAVLLFLYSPILPFFFLLSTVCLSCHALSVCNMKARTCLQFVNSMILFLFFFSFFKILCWLQSSLAGCSSCCRGGDLHQPECKD